MQKIFLWLGCACLLWLAACQQKENVDLLLVNGKIYTADSVGTISQALAVRNGNIVALGTTDELSARYTAAERIDLGGKLVLPGLHDAHAHPIGGAKQLEECQLSGLKTPAEILAAVKKFADEHPEKPYVPGRGWELFVFLPDGNPSKHLLDSIVPDRPVILDSWDGHSVWVNSKALALAGIDKNTPDPPQGRIERDPRTGEPTGTLREEAANLVAKLQPADTEADRLRYLENALKLANSIGITSLIDASAAQPTLEVYAQLLQQGKLSARVILAHSIGLNGRPNIAQLDSLRKKYTVNEFLRASSVKVFTDGVPEAHTAALLAPYTDRPQDYGIMNYHPDSLARYCREMDGAGFQIHFHALGDKAIRASLDALQGSKPALRHHISHLQFIDKADVPRFAQLGAVANFQPFWAKGDDLNIRLISRIMGPERAKSQYPMASVLKSGAHLAAGSDWPVSTFNPFEAIQVAVTRQQIAYPDDKPWIPEERLSLEQIIQAYTRGGAYVMHQEQRTGSLQAGKAADLIVLDQDMFSIAPSEIHKTKVLLTLLAGKAVHRSAEFAPAAAQ